MSTTSTYPSNREWLRRLLSGKPHQVIGGVEHPYLRRWYLIPRNPVLNVYLHQFLRSDDDRALHDHPWWFVSLILKGGYTEVTEQGTKRRRAGSIAFRRAAWRHRVALERQPIKAWEGFEIPGRELPCWTLIVTGRRVREWGFWCKDLPDRYAENNAKDRDRFVPWRDFGDAGCGEP